MAGVVVASGGNPTVIAIARGSAEGLNLKVGDRIKAVVKATEGLDAKV
jgi:molybdopterin-binding protein